MFPFVFHFLFVLAYNIFFSENWHYKLQYQERLQEKHGESSYNQFTTYIHYLLIHVKVSHKYSVIL